MTDFTRLWQKDCLTLRESIPRLFNEGGGGGAAMTTRCAPACSQALPVKPQGVWARGIEAWAGSRDLRNLEFRRWGFSGPSSLMTKCPYLTVPACALTSAGILPGKKKKKKIEKNGCKFCQNGSILLYVETATLLWELSCKCIAILCFSW